MTDTLQQLSKEMADLVDNAAESVLRVNARRRLPATGIAWSENLIVTAHHVVESGDISIGLPDGERIDARLVGRDPRNDLALLQVDASLKPANRADDGSLRVGNLVLALGRPRQHVKATLGVVSGLVVPGDARRRRQHLRARFAERGRERPNERRRKRWQRRAMQEIGAGWAWALPDGMIQTDVTMYPGFSGGPLLGVDGKVYGMNTSGFAGGISVAVPFASISKSVAALLADGKIQTGYLGVGVQPAQLPDSIAEALQQETGLLIVSIEADSPAAAAGMLVGDILTALDEEALEDVDELQLLLARLAPGREAKTGYVRGGEFSEGSVVIGAN